MKTRRLIIIRHAEAAGANSGGDRQRVLTDEGRRQAEALGSALAGQVLGSATVLVSPARRTVQTWAAVAQAGQFGEGLETAQVEDIYGGWAGSVLDLVRQVHPSMDTVVIVGHEPTVTDLALGLTVPQSAPQGFLSHGFATGSAIILEAARDWAAWAPECGSLVKAIR